jgi:hypothetical protein
MKSECERSMPCGASEEWRANRLDSRDHVASGVKCGPHSGKKSESKSWTRSWCRVAAHDRSLHAGFVTVNHETVGLLG